MSRFRRELTKKKAYDRLLKKFNWQLSKHKLILTTGSAKVDASLTESSFNPKGVPTYEIAEDRQEDQRSKKDKVKASNYHNCKKNANLPATHTSTTLSVNRAVQAIHTTVKYLPQSKKT